MLAFACDNRNSVVLFNGIDLLGWEGDTINTWRVESGVIVGGSLSETVPYNDFLCTLESYDNFMLSLKYKIEGNEGFINGGVQFRSERMTNPSYEMIGYQSDIGSKLDGALYDESRRNTFLAGWDTVRAANIAQHGQWNHMKILAENHKVRIFVNGQLTADYVEADTSIIHNGRIGLQVHGDGKTLISFKDIIIEHL